MKAKLKEVKVWQPHRDKTKEEHHIIDKGMLQVYVGSLFVGWIYPVESEPEETYKLDAGKLLIYMDTNDNLQDSLIQDRKKQRGKPLQEILDNIELVFKDFLNKVVK